MNTKHTPGPWTVSPVERYPRTVRVIDEHKNSKTICIANGSPSFKEGEPEANAKLIAAAPQLLESVKQFVWNWENDIWTDADIEVAIAAIKKATE